MSYDPKQSDPKRFRPKVIRNSKGDIIATLLPGLCKSCGECIAKCPMKCISFDETELGTTGEPAIVIDMEKCIGCGTCEMICPDFAVKITKEPSKEPSK
ncbi:4Fe-4S binding protein [Candidatus Uhrbacteria bacterium]|nr:4Fe-4S binding protein [Candidatus Uhrbacteria bacterium]